VAAYEVGTDARFIKLTGSEQDVLIALTEGMSISSVVTLAADLYQRGRNAGFNGGDIVGYVTLVLEGLNEKGLVQYRVPTGHESGSSTWAGLPMNVRLTPEGWATTGYPRFHSEVGRNSRRREVARGDRTDFRNHATTAEGSDLERLPWYEHRAVYPDHAHNYELFGVLTDLEKDMAETRTWNRVTPEMEDRVQAAFGRHKSYAETAAETNLSERQVRYILSGKTSLGSLKQRMLALIEQRGKFADIHELYEELPGSHGMHNFVHVLHSLHSEGVIDFREVKAGTGGTSYLDIRAAKRRTNGEAKPEPEVVEAEADVTAVSQPEEVAHTPVGESYPELARIRELNATLMRQRGAADRYMKAAEALGNDDPDMVELLLRKATEAEVSSLNPVESEYLQWVEAHGQSEG
jgi:hypothetical protein